MMLLLLTLTVLLFNGTAIAIVAWSRGMVVSAERQRDAYRMVANQALQESDKMQNVIRGLAGNHAVDKRWD